MKPTAKFLETHVLKMYHELQEHPAEFLHKSVVQADVYPFATPQTFKEGLARCKPNPQATHLCMMFDCMTENLNFSACGGAVDLSGEISFKPS